MKNIWLLALSLGLMACQNQTQRNSLTPDDIEEAFKTVIDQKPVQLIRIKNGNISASLTNYGARLVSLFVPDTKGHIQDVILGYDSAAEFKDNANNFYGAIIGRYGNRLGNATFSLDGQTFSVDKNDGKHSLHGGKDGFYNQVFDIIATSDSAATLQYRAADMEAGYPGNLTVEVTYSISAAGGLVITYLATTDKSTVVNLTNHAYFNLNGAGDSTILDHQLLIDADHFTEVDQQLIPTGRHLSVEGTAFDFRKAKAIGADIHLADPQLDRGKGYDHNFVLNKKSGYARVAELYAPKTGIVMQVWTSEPGLQFYSGNFMSAADPTGKAGKTYAHRAALCLETQHFPDAPNQALFPSTRLNPGEQYRSQTAYMFATR